MLPYPFFIDLKGMVGRQDFWKGKPLKLIGFNPKYQSGVMDGTLILKDFLEKPKKAITMFPIFEYKDKKYYTYGLPIESVIINS